MPEPGCLICGAHLMRPAVGRPPRYCSRTCRRAAELELQRLQTRLAKLEGGASNLRLYGAPKRQLDRIQAEIDTAAGRQRVLLSGLPEPVSPDRAGGGG